MKFYVMYHDHPTSIQYMKECVDSGKRFGIDIIPIEGYNAVDPTTIANDFDTHLIPYFKDKASTEEYELIKRSFSGAGSNYRIWKLIAESNEPGIILEHDAIIMSPMTDLVIEDNCIVWLGPRIIREEDYSVPIGTNFTYLEVDRWEGTHAYGITPGTARYLLDQLKYYGLNDSLDGQLGMRNMFDLKFVAADPPPIVAVVGDRVSTIGDSKTPVFFNAPYTPGFVKNYKGNPDLLRNVRALQFKDRSFDRHKDRLTEIFNSNLNQNSSRTVLVLNADEGYEALWLNNKLMIHPESNMLNICSTRMFDLCKYNTYFSKFYYKMQYHKLDFNYPELLAIYEHGVKFDLIYGKSNGMKAENMLNEVVCWNLLSEGGLLILDNHPESIMASNINKQNILINEPGFLVLKK